MSGSVEAKIRSRCVENSETGCWDWSAARNAYGYGVIWHLGRLHMAHRVSFLASGGKIPDGAYVCHRCDNRACVNPAHLFAGTQFDNMRDAASKGRSARGETHGQTKMRREDVVSILRQRENGQSIRRIAAIFGLSYSGVRHILRHRASEATI